MFLFFKSVAVWKYLAIKHVCCVEEFSFITVAKIDLIVIMSTLAVHCYKRNKTLSRRELELKEPDRSPSNVYERWMELLELFENDLFFRPQYNEQYPVTFKMWGFRFYSRWSRSQQMYMKTDQFTHTDSLSFANNQFLLNCQFIIHFHVYKQDLSKLTFVAKDNAITRVHFSLPSKPDGMISSLRQLSAL